MWLFCVVMVLTEELAWLLWLTWNKSILLFDMKWWSFYAFQMIYDLLIWQWFWLLLLKENTCWAIKKHVTYFVYSAAWVCMFFRGLKLNSWMERSSENTMSTQGTEKQTSLSPTGIPTTGKWWNGDTFLIFSLFHVLCWFLFHLGEWCVWRRSMWLDISIKNGSVSLRIS